MIVGIDVYVEPILINCFGNIVYLIINSFEDCVSLLQSWVWVGVVRAMLSSERAWQDVAKRNGKV